MSFEQTSRLTEAQIENLHHMYQQEWWTKDRKFADIRTMLAHSDLIIAFCESEQQQLAAFARVLTDFVYKALVFDVIVDPRFRSQGLGRQLLDAVVLHPALKSVQHLELYCLPEMIPFYKRWGFATGLDGAQPMRLTR